MLNVVCRLVLFLSTLTMLLVSSGCDRVPGSRGSIDAEWHRNALIDGHLSRWLAVAPTSSGLFSTAFDRHWRPKPANGGDLTAQSRLIYAMAMGYELTKDRRYLDAATRGADFLLERFHDPIYGGFYMLVAADGKVINGTKRAYGNAFALFALSHMYRVTKEERFRTAAIATWREINRNLRDANGGFRQEAPRNFAPSPADSLTQNPVMHMFEALLALCDATGDAEALAGATSVGNFVVYHLMQGLPDGSAYIPEWYDATWRPLPTKEKGGYVDLGHQFEWSHLLRTAEQRGLPPIYTAASERVLQYAIKVGYDEFEGGAFNRAYPDGTIDRDKAWWPQSECLRALIVAASGTGRRDLWRRYEQTLDMVRNEFIDAENGGWRTGSSRVCGGCADEQPDPYHMTGMHLAAMKAASANSR